MRRRYVFGAVAVIALLSASVVVGATFVTTGKTVSHVNVTRENLATVSNATFFNNVPSAFTTISVPSGENALILARFSAESACYGGTGYCSVRILINGVEMDPVAGFDFAFDSTDLGRETSGSWESHSMDRSRVVGSGTYTIVVQRATTSASTFLRLDEWSLTVERAQL